MLKQYNKGGRVLRTEACINDPRDFTIGKSLVHLGYLGRIAYHAITRFQKAQAVALASALDRSTFERIVTPSTNGGQRVAGIRFGAPRAMRILEALGCAGLTFKAFGNREFRAVLVERFGADPAEVTPARVRYELAKLRGKGLVRKVSGRNLYTLTDLGYRVALYCTKLHQRLLAPALDSLDSALRPSAGIFNIALTIPGGHIWRIWTENVPVRRHERWACAVLWHRLSSRSSLSSPSDVRGRRPRCRPHRHLCRPGRRSSISSPVTSSSHPAS
ncbi:MAG: hypothetical protein QN183_15155 [Armatimonadota bacterium]|nr:hypothetical protein [Armatimonadota bacterium]